MNQKILPCRLIFTLSLLALAGTDVCHAKSKLPENTPVPDLTTVVIADLSHTYHLGPTGARGWIHKLGSYATPDDFEGYFTNELARQILITAVEKGSPADGVLEAGDVILGTGNAPFDRDARKAFADAIDEAEKEENKGVLRLLRWRPDAPDKEDATVRSEGIGKWVELHLKVMGTFSDTAPYDCLKSAAIVKETAELIFSEKRTDQLHIAALGLLATGEEKYLAAVRDYIRQKGIANPKMKLTVATAQGSSAWSWSYAAILLGEYYLLTGDKDVLPALETYAVTLAKGQSIAGNWGHKMADLAYNDGNAHGRLTGYGALNQVGLTCFMAMNIAERCGIRHPELTRAIAHSSDFFGYFAEKGAIPYGHDHPLEYMVTNNGMSGSAAIAFAMKGDTARAHYFSRLCAAAHGKTEVGHTGPYFGAFWTPLGANLAGPDTCAEFFKEHRWLHTLARKWNGGFVYQPPGGRWGGSSESYYGLSSDAAYLMFYATPRRQLLLTGKEPDKSIWLEGEQARAAVAAALIDYGSKSDGQLLELLGNPVPMVRRKAADALGTREGEFVGPLRTMLASGSRDAKVGATHGLAALKEQAAPAIDELVAVIGNPKEDLWVRNRALLALPAIGKPAQRAVDGLLRISLADQPEDARGDLNKEIALTIAKLVEDPYQTELDQDLFYAAVTKFLDHPHHLARTAAMKLVSKIPSEDFHLMADAIIRVIRGKNAAYETYHIDAERAAGLAILERLNIRDGIDLCIETLETDKWGQKWRVYGETGRLATLAKYGANAKRVLPQLKAMRASRKIGEAADGLLKTIEQSTESRKLISLDEAIRIGREKAKPGTKDRVKVDVDWPGFMGRHDLIWDVLPTGFDYGAFLGNGMLGSTIYQDGPSRLRWEMGRSDVTEHRRDNARLPIGGLLLTTVGKIQKGTMRMDLWNAEVRGTVTTDKGTITFRSLIHTDEMVMITDMTATAGERDAGFAWEARPCIDPRNAKRFNDPPNPPAVTETVNGVAVCAQARFAGGGFATAWKETPLGEGRRIIVSIADSFPETTAATQAVATVEKAAGSDFATLLDSHRAWWQDFYPKSMVSVPDPKLESFYWIQFYKLASASRPHLVPVDLLGPWYRQTGWPRIWWNLNIETLYLPVYTGNRLELGESFINFIDAKRENFYRNAKDLWGFDGCATVPHTTCYEGLRGDGTAAPDKYINPGDFTWALHNYYLHYRYTMDHSLVTDHSKHAFYPLLRDSINLYLKILKKGGDGKLHLPTLHSPEYGDDADNNYNLSLLRWGCRTLIELNQRYNLGDPLVPVWKKTLAELVPYPVDENGFRIGANIAFTKSHRHWSHILMVHPLHIMTGDQPEDRELLTKSVLHWLTVDNSKGINGWSRAAAASLYATLGDGDNAIKQIHGHMADKRFVRPNTMYIEGSPVIECAIVLNRSLQDMLLQSWGGKIAVFPAIPGAWKSAVFDDLRAEGAFLVSAERKRGETAWVRIRSLAGEPCRVQPNMNGKITIMINETPTGVAPSADGIFELPLEQGDEAILYPGDHLPDLTITPLPADPAQINPFGSPR